MRKTYDEISGKTRFDTEQRSLFKTYGLLGPKEFLRINFALVKSEKEEVCWLQLSAQSHNSVWDNGYEVLTMLDDYRSTFNADIEDTEFDLGFGWSSELARWMYAEILWVSVPKEWVQRCAKARVAKIRAAFRDAELPNELKQDAMEILRHMK